MHITMVLYPEQSGRLDLGIANVELFLNEPSLEAQTKRGGGVSNDHRILAVCGTGARATLLGRLGGASRGVSSRCAVLCSSSRS